MIYPQNGGEQQILGIWYNEENSKIQQRRPSGKSKKITANFNFSFAKLNLTFLGT